MPILQSFAGASARGFGFSAASPTGDFNSIATFTVASGTQPYAEFTSIPTTYKHLQIRFYSKATTTNNPLIQFGSSGALDTTSSNYYWHHFWTSGSGANNSNGGNSTSLFAYNSTSTYPCSGVIDLLDYTNSTKKVFKSIFGIDNTGGVAEVGMFNGNWAGTGVVDTIRISPGVGSWDTTTRFALYGIKG